MVLLQSTGKPLILQIEELSACCVSAPSTPHRQWSQRSVHRSLLNPCLHHVQDLLEQFYRFSLLSHMTLLGPLGDTIFSIFSHASPTALSLRWTSQHSSHSWWNALRFPSLSLSSLTEDFLLHLPRPFPWFHVCCQLAWYTACHRLSVVFLGHWKVVSLYFRRSGLGSRRSWPRSRMLRSHLKEACTRHWYWPLLRTFAPSSMVKITLSWS